MFQTLLRVAFHVIRTADGDAKAGSINTYGDVQLNIDLYADQ